MSHWHDECAVCGLWGFPQDASKLGALALHALQHRGQEATGLVVTDGKRFSSYRSRGLVCDVLTPQRVVDGLRGHALVGHNRYSTAGSNVPDNIQPFFADLPFGGCALAHNGHLTNAMTLKKHLMDKGSLFRSTSDSEVILHAMAHGEGTADERLVQALEQIQGAYALTILTTTALIGVRDPFGVRPLVLGKLGKGYILASETVALDSIGARFLREVEPGEMVVINEEVHSSFPFPRTAKRFCVFEHIYFSRPDSLLEGRSVYTTRKKLGRRLAQESPVEADVVVPVPDSGIPGALGYAQEAHLPFEYGIMRSHYIGRTFIRPSFQERHESVRLKHNANRIVVEGKRIVLVDDSIVRGTTSRRIITMLREAGVKSVHLRVTCPPTRHACFYGVDTPDTDKLFAHQHSLKEMTKLLGVDSLAFLSLQGLHDTLKSASEDDDGLCDACFSGRYFIPLTDHMSHQDVPTTLDRLEKPT